MTATTDNHELRDQHIATLEEILAEYEGSGFSEEKAALRAAIALMRGQSEELERDAVAAKYLPTGSIILGDQDYETTKPCFEVVHRGYRYYMSPASKQSISRLNEQDAAMQKDSSQ